LLVSRTCQVRRDDQWGAVKFHMAHHSVPRKSAAGDKGFSTFDSRNAAPAKNAVFYQHRARSYKQFCCQLNECNQPGGVALSAPSERQGGELRTGSGLTTVGEINICQQLVPRVAETIRIGNRKTGAGTDHWPPCRAVVLLLYAVTCGSWVFPSGTVDQFPPFSDTILMICGCVVITESLASLPPAIEAPSASSV